ncbi:anthranilate phosphoribosyltransferase [Sulfurimonas sp. HSL-1716]|uniref:anthranilate phosphoribosyltransferase n=1 Tax=Hydrocurvibacter sulfurireducens TaxID=3131937 RepID=UPI0031F765A0
MTYQESLKKFELLFDHKMNDEQMRDFLIGLRLNESTNVDTIAAAAHVMKAHSLCLPVQEELKEKIIDIVGTGGDKIGSFNISSTVALLVASAGAYVAKHGSRSVTSKSGSADMFEKLGVRLDLSIDNSARLLEETGFTFMFAQNYHPAMKFIMPIRKSIPDKTIFNILGPLTNPAGVKKTLLGVFDKSFVKKLADALKMNGSSDAMVVSSKERMDEISISDITYAARLKNGSIEEFVIDPLTYGIKRVPLSAIMGGDGEENAKILTNIFDNRATDAQRDIVLINAAAAFVVEGMARDLQDGIDIAKEALLSDRAKVKLQQIIEVSSKL